MMNLSKKDTLQLRRLYKDAIDQGEEQFIFRSNVILTKYAKYLLEYIDSQNK